MSLSILINQSTNQTSSIISNVTWAVIILFGGLLIAYVSKKVSLKFLTEIELNDIFKKTTSKNWKLDMLLANTLNTAIYFVTIVWALELLGISILVLNIVSLVIFVLLIIVLILSIKDFFPNFIAGMLIKHNYKVGQKIKIDRVSGKISSVSVLKIIIKTEQDQSIHIPTSYLLKSKF